MSADSGVVPGLSRDVSPHEKMSNVIAEQTKPGVLNVSVPSTDRTITELNNNDESISGNVFF
jgi:hypothetical protein